MHEAIKEIIRFAFEDLKTPVIYAFISMIQRKISKDDYINKML